MIGPLLALALPALALAAPVAEPTDLTQRLRESAIEAERLQGPMDGTWRLRDSRNRPILVLQIGDPADGGPMAAAWRSTKGPPRLGVASRIVGTGGRLTFELSSETGPVIIAGRLTRRRPNLWTGWLTLAGHVTPVSMTRERGALDGER